MPPMRFLLFDVKPSEDRVQQYLDTAAALRPGLDAQGGCLFIDRFRDLDDPAWLLSFQIWRDEQALLAWRGDAKHRAAQALGRERVFDDYRIRVGSIVSPQDAAAKGRYVVLLESTRAEPRSPLPKGRVKRFSSLYREGQFMHVASAGSLAAAEQAAAAFGKALEAPVARIGLIDRDYGLYERAEAPQSFPERTR
jgi:heme-degrading monooxygenase HmoA